MRLTEQTAKIASAENRRWARYSVDVRIRVRVGSGDAGKLVFGRGSDVSEGGMALFVPLEMRDGDACEVEFTPPYSRVPLRILATVRNRTGFRYGVEFRGTSASQRGAILELCKMLSLVQ